MDEITTNWTITLPIYNLDISKDIGGEFCIENVIFVRKDKIPRIRKRLGLEYPVSTYNKWFRLKEDGKLFNKSSVYAFVKHNRTLKEPLNFEYNKIQEAVYLLASSQFGREKRTRKYIFGLPNFENHTDEVVMFENNSNKANLETQVINPLEPYLLNKQWKSFFRNHFFFDLLKVLNNRNPVKPKWKYCIRTAALLAGRSHFTNNLWEAFLFDIIAIETLLSKRGSKIKDNVTKNLVALFGWLTDEHEEYWKDLIERLYALRSDFVHTGSIKNLKVRDLIEADMILSNLLKNICRLTKTIKSQNDLFELSQKLEARRILNMKMVERPFISFGKTNYSNDDIKKLEERKHWFL